MAASGSGMGGATESPAPRSGAACGDSPPGLAELPMLARIVEQVGDGVAVVDNDGWFVLVNPAFAAIHGCPGQDLVGEHFSVFYSPADQAGPVQQLIAAALCGGVARAELVRCRRDGSPFPAQVTLSLLHDDAGQLVGRVLSVQDITDRKHLEDQLRRLALHDPLTGLPNRRLLLDRLAHALNRGVRHDHQVAVLFLDLDGFKAINDTWGHAAGDELLVEVAARLTACLRPEDTVARLGGDEFVIVLDEVAEAHEPLRIAERVRSALSTPVPLGGGSTRVTTSIGVSLAGRGPAQDVLRAADTAMYRAKARGKDRVETDQ